MFMTLSAIHRKWLDIITVLGQDLFQKWIYTQQWSNAWYKKKSSYLWEETHKMGAMSVDFCQDIEEEGLDIKVERLVV